MTSQPDQQTIVTHLLPNISRSKDNVTLKFGQLIEYNIHKMWWRNKSQILFWKVKIGHISGLIA